MSRSWVNLTKHLTSNLFSLCSSTFLKPHLRQNTVLRVLYKTNSFIYLHKVYSEGRTFLLRTIIFLDISNKQKRLAKKQSTNNKSSGLQKIISTVAFCSLMHSLIAVKTRILKEVIEIIFKTLLWKSLQKKIPSP